MKELIERIWWSRGKDRASGAVYALRLLLIPVSLLYGWVSELRNLLFDLDLLSSRSAARPTVSVGNLTVGGTGKTPFVETLAQNLAADGNRVAILSRGYGTGTEGDDEALLLKDDTSAIRRWTHPDRLEAARQAMEGGPPDLFLMDDGFQHRRMARDLDLVLVDGLRMFGNGYPLPAGPLREPTSRIRRADFVVITRSNRLDRNELRSVHVELNRLLDADTPVLHAHHRPVRIVRRGNNEELSAGRLRNRRLFAFCGIGNPASFRHTLRDDLDLDPVAFRSYPDHHAYRSDDRSELLQRAKELDVEYLVTTRKDAVKWPVDPSIPLAYVDVEVRVTRGASVLDRALHGVLEKKYKETGSGG